MFNRRWGQDRRRFQRLNLNLVVWYKALNPAHVRMLLGTSEREAITEDISPFGMAFMSRHIIPVFSDLALKFIIFASQSGNYDRLTIPMEVNARVRSCGPWEHNQYRVGVSFSDIELEKQQRLAHFMRESMRAII